MSRAAYEIRAAGEVPARLLEDFAGVTVTVDPVGTTIHADLADEAELHGLLDALTPRGLRPRRRPPRAVVRPPEAPATPGHLTRPARGRLGRADAGALGEPAPVTQHGSPTAHVRQADRGRRSSDGPGTL